MTVANDIAKSEFFKSHRNAERIYAQGTMVINSKMPRAVRNELMEAVKVGMIGRHAKSGLKPEIFFDPRHTQLAREIQANEALYSIDCIRKCVRKCVA